MSDYTEGSRRKDRHRRHKNPANRNAPASGRDNQSAREPPQRKEERFFEPLPKLPELTCTKCGEIIQDSTSALLDKATSGPIHFDCALAFLQGSENLSESEKIIYIGQGRFAVVQFENPQDTRKFKIIRTIEWENRESKAEWRTDISNRFTHIK